jgi:hypothetical protein
MSNAAPQLLAHKQDLADKLQGLVSTCSTLPGYLTGDSGKQVPAHPAAAPPAPPRAQTRAQQQHRDADHPGRQGPGAEGGGDHGPAEGAQRARSPPLPPPPPSPRRPESQVVKRAAPPLQAVSTWPKYLQSFDQGLDGDLARCARGQPARPRLANCHLHSR